MKKAFILIIFFFSALVLRAGGVDENRAKEIARNFFLSEKLRAEPAMLVPLETSSVSTRSGGALPAYYIINREGGGFVILSADTAVEPVLAYSLDKTFSLDNPPAAVLATLGEYEKAVDKARRLSLEPSPEIRSRWEELSAPATRGDAAGEPVPIVELETALWSQEAPYNLLCPKLGGRTSVTGCVATAMAIILHYMKYPERGVGTIPEYTFSWNGRLVSEGSVTLGEEYLWDKMPSSTSEFRTEEQKMQVARLMRDCGHMVKMQYSPDGSGAYSEDIVPALQQFMGYDAEARFIYRAFCSTQQWIDLVEGELREGRPVYMSGVSPNNEGHAFVADGFDDRHYVRFNWGWAGVCNGYFSLAPYGYADEVRDPEFFSQQDAILGLKPASGSQEPQPLSEIWWNPTPSVYLGVVSESDVAPGPGDDFEVVARELKWIDTRWEEIPFPFYSSDGYEVPSDYEIIVAHVGADGTVKEYVSDAVTLEAAGRVACRMERPVETGDVLKIFFRAPGGGEWRPVSYHSDIANGEISLKETVSAQAFMSARILRDDVYVTEAGKYSRVLEVRTKRGVRASLYSPSGYLVSALGEAGRRPEAIVYTPDYQTIRIVLANLSAGRYRLVLERNFDDASFEFTFE